MPDPVKPTTLAEALQHLDDKNKSVIDLLHHLRSEKDHAKALAFWQDMHEEVLLLKSALNATYRHLVELKPKTPKADKMKPGGKIDNAPNRGESKGKKRDETKVDEANSDEP